MKFCIMTFDDMKFDNTKLCVVKFSNNPAQNVACEAYQLKSDIIFV